MSGDAAEPEPSRSLRALRRCAGPLRWPGEVLALLRRRGEAWKFWAAVLGATLSLTIIGLAWVAYQARQDDRRHIRQIAVVVVQNRHALAEVCRTNAVFEGVLTAIVGLLTPTSGSAARVPPDRREAFAAALAAFRGFRQELREQTACGRVARP